ncbi:flagellar assembly peptidoglycan hydrolase FlgJ [Thiobacillus sedimenti]|uniref:Peptidoglycan hydrolase FlgJ n=1 Tax=Thiobacillus sedimenti TaxID=3110231 RepID=A0ABZ1CM02_9PROT|nr:flagellar assembly peptidoglycan hydrolase FlgJ [Thiobacillus sp. SCUT-2]WRS40234.1 flagellar assembly peptidoglycan hydrolase FlgJ [Thiobacillus sp. SCUT-2]
MAIGSADLASRFALDVQSVGQLKLEAKQSSPEALRAAAQQFEAVFLNMMMKSMREATPQDGMLDSEQTRMYTSMLDQQLTQKLATRGIGLADVMVRQLSRTLNLAAPGAAAQLGEGPAAALPPGTVAPSAVPQAADAPRSGDVPAHVGAFVRKLLPHAEAASAASGIPARFMVGQAALETGWGRSEIRGPDGRNSHNLFGIKAGPSWKGRTVDVVTTEYVNGRPQKQVASFRAYDSYADAFRDYANLLRGQARYQNAIAGGQDAAGFAQGLQQAGYATDPAYANKLMGAIRLVETA